MEAFEAVYTGLVEGRFQGGELREDEKEGEHQQDHPHDGQVCKLFSQLAGLKMFMLPKSDINVLSLRSSHSLVKIDEFLGRKD